MNISESHSWVTHSLPKRSAEKISVCGIFLVSTRYCPVLRCHQKSESVIGRALAAKITSMKIKTRSRRLERSMSTKPSGACSRIPTGENSMLSDCLMLTPSQVSELSKDCGANENHTQAAAGDCEGPFHQQTLATQDPAQHDHATFPPILLIERKDVSRSKHKIHDTEPSSTGCSRRKQVNNNSSQENKNLLAEWSLLELTHVQANVGT